MSGKNILGVRGVRGVSGVVGRVYSSGKLAECFDAFLVSAVFRIIRGVGIVGLLERLDVALTSDKPVVSLGLEVSVRLGMSVIPVTATLAEVPEVAVRFDVFLVPDVFGVVGLLELRSVRVVVERSDVLRV